MRSARIGLVLIAALAAQAAAGEGGTGLRSAAPDAPVFSARLYGAPFALIAIVPNPIERPFWWRNPRQRPFTAAAPRSRSRRPAPRR